MLAGLLRLVVATFGGWLLALRLTGSQGWLFAALAAGLLLYGMVIPISILRGAWTAGSNPRRATA